MSIDVAELSKAGTCILHIYSGRSWPYTWWKCVLRLELFKTSVFISYRASWTSLFFAVCEWNPSIVGHRASSQSVMKPVACLCLEHKLSYSTALYPSWLPHWVDCIQTPEAPPWSVGEFLNTGEYGDQIEYLKQKCCLYDNNNKFLKKGFREIKVYISNNINWKNESQIVSILMPSLKLWVWWISTYRETVLKKTSLSCKRFLCIWTMYIQIYIFVWHTL